MSSIPVGDVVKGFLAVVGGIKIAKIAWRTATFIWVNFMAGVNMKKKYGKFGDWAVVTGGSDGIGEAMALDLSRRGFNVCVIARTQSKLIEVVKAIECSGVKGMFITFDFSTASDKEYSMLWNQLDALNIAVLVNNVGIGYPYVNYFGNFDVDKDLRLLKVNMEPVVRMTKYVVPRMKTVGGGAIIMLSSFSALTPTPLLSTYAGTKAFSLSFGEALFYELKEYGIDILAVTPNLVSSKFTQYNETAPPATSFLMVSAKPMARQALDKLGSVRVTSGHRNHAITEMVLMSVPQFLRSLLVLDNLRREHEKGVRTASKS